MVLEQEAVKETKTTESILCVDVGSLWTRAALIDQVDGLYSFVACGEARTTVDPPTPNVMVGVQNAVWDIQQACDRPVVSTSPDGEVRVLVPEDESGEGVDVFLSTTSAFFPLKVVLFGESSADVSAALAGVRATYAHVVGTFSGGQHGRWGELNVADVIQIVDRERPEVLFFVAVDAPAFTSTAQEFLNTLELINTLYDVRERPTVVLVGQNTLLGHLFPPVEETNLVQKVTLAPNEEATAIVGRLFDTFNELLHERRLARIPGFGALQAWSEAQVQPTATAQARAMEWLARQVERRIVLLDIGAENSQIVATDARFFRSLVHPGEGLGFSLLRLIEKVGLEAVYRWTPGLMPERDLHSLLVHRSWYPYVRPATRDALWLEQAVARAIAQQLIVDLAPTLPETFRDQAGNLLCDYVIGTGAVIRHAPQPAQALLMLLDALQPAGVVHLLRDRLGLLPALGMLSQSEPDAVGDLLSQDVLESLGTVVVLSGQMAPGKEVLRFRMRYPDGGTYTVTVEAGRLYREYLPPGVQLDLELRPARKVDIGLGPGEPARVQVTGGTVGLVIDARGRPLPTQASLVEQRRQVHEWLLYVGG